jgi:hypothetical protein
MKVTMNKLCLINLFGWFTPFDLFVYIYTYETRNTFKARHFMYEPLLGKSRTCANHTLMIY